MIKRKWKNAVLSKPRKARSKKEAYEALWYLAKNAVPPSFDKERHRQAKLIVLLFDEFEVEKGNFLKLCHAMANAFVPAFQTMKGQVGRVSRWSKWDYAGLRLELDKIMAAEKNCTLLRAAEKLKAEQKDRKIPEYKHVTCETLVRYYTKADLADVEILRNPEHAINQLSIRQKIVAEMVEKMRNLDMDSLGKDK